MKKFLITSSFIILAFVSIINPVFASSQGINTGSLVGVSITPPTSYREISPYGTEKPKSVWNLSTEGLYEVDGDADFNDLYTNYVFTGASAINMNLTNRGDADIVVTCYKDSLFDSVVSRIIFYPGKYHYTWTGLDSSAKYYFKFDKPCHFTGEIFKTA